MRVVAVLSRYALSSLAVTAVDFSAFALLLPYVSGDVVRANILARAFAVVAHLLLSREYVFRARASSGCRRSSAMARSSSPTLR